MDNHKLRQDIKDSIKKFENKTGFVKSILQDENYKLNKFKFDEKMCFQYYTKTK